MKRWLARQEVSAALMIIALSILFHAVNPAFLTWANIASMFRAMALPGMIAIGMTFCLMAGTIDLSVGAAAGFASSLVAVLITQVGWPIWAAVGLSVLIAALWGIVNCFIIFRLHIIPFISTIGMMYVLKSLANWLTNGASIYPIPDILTLFGNAKPLGVSWPFWIFFGSLILAGVILSQTVWGLEVRATGSDREIARDTEVRVDLVNYSTFIILGIMAGLSGILATARIGAGNPTIGTGWEFQAILACALGGVSLFGYEGSMPGTFLGLLLIQIILTGLVEVGMSPYLEGAVLGGLLITSLALDVRKRRLLRQEI